MKILSFYEIPAAIKALYDRPGGVTGCCLHITLDDNNVEAGHVAFCVDTAYERGHEDCKLLALSMLALRDDAQRLAVMRNAGYAGSKADEYEASRS
jgi:hypothetical protein